MKLCLVYNPKDSKLRSTGAYCSIFKDMFNALVDKFDCWQFITSDCSADDIEADIIFFFDPHSSHHIKIDGVEKHSAVKMEYWNDLHQREVIGISKITNKKVHKLGEEQRVRRAKDRGIDFIVSVAKYFFYEHFEKYFGSETEKILLYFPHAPRLNGFSPMPYLKRKVAVLGNGATWGCDSAYAFRSWAFKQPYIDFVEHYLKDSTTPSGNDFLGFLNKYSGALALSTPFPVPKYIEIPAAGTVMFAEYHKEWEELGFIDGKTCIYVDKINFRKKITDFLMEPEEYMNLANAGRDLVLKNYTSKHFAKFIYDNARDKNGGYVLSK